MAKRRRGSGSFPNSKGPSRTEPKKQAASKARARRKVGKKSKADIKDKLQRTYGEPAVGYWNGMSEGEWARRSRWTAGEIYRRGQGKGQNYIDRILTDPDNGFPNFPEPGTPEFRKFVAEARRTGNSRHIFYGVPHAAAAEEGWLTYDQLSGGTLQRNNAGDVTDIDLTEGFDVQNITGPRNEAALSLGIKKELDIPWAGVDAWEDATPDTPLSKIIADSGPGYDDKLWNPKVKRIGGHIKDKAEPGRGRFGLRKDHGTFVKEQGYSEYVLDLEDARKQMPNWTKGEIEALGAKLIKDEKKLKLQIPLKNLQEKLGQVGKIHEFIDDDVLESIDEIGRETGVRRAGDISYHSGLPPQAVDTLKNNWRGGLTNTVLSGASREVGKKIGEGDIAGAVAEGGKEYVKGAIVESGIRAAGKTGAWKGATRMAGAVGTALAKRLPASMTRFAVGTKGSLGLLAPAMAAWTAYDVADGITEGVTGKTIMQHADGNLKDYAKRTTGENRDIDHVPQAKVQYKPEPAPGPAIKAGDAKRISSELTKLYPDIQYDVEPVAQITQTKAAPAPQEKSKWTKRVEARRSTPVRQSAPPPAPKPTTAPAPKYQPRQTSTAKRTQAVTKAKTVVKAYEKRKRGPRK